MSTARADFWAWFGLVAVFSLAAVCMIVSAGNWRMWQSDAGLQIRTELGVTGPMTPWVSIVRVRATWTQVVVFQTAAGGELRVPLQTAGLLEAIRTARAHGAELDTQLAKELGTDA
jgi:hypothetical protein